VQFDEKWSSVGKKEKHGDADDSADARHGDNWDAVAFDAEHRLVRSGVPGKRTEDKAHQLVGDFKTRTGGRLMNLLTSDAYRAYKKAIFAAYAVEPEQTRTGRRGRPKKPKKVRPKGLKYATVHKERENGRVVKVDEAHQKTGAGHGQGEAERETGAVQRAVEAEDRGRVERPAGEAGQAPGGRSSGITTTRRTNCSWW
jgi:hypothetical protein